MKFAQIIIDNRSSQVDRLFTYKIGESLLPYLEEGMRVVVPFGRSNKPTKGLVINIHQSTENIKSFKIKEIIDIMDEKPLISKKLIELGLWMREEYLCSHMDSFSPILPPGDYKKLNTIIESISSYDKSSDSSTVKIVNYIENKSTCLLSDLKDDLNLNNISKIIRELEEDGYIKSTISIETTVKRKIEKRVKINEEIPSEDAFKIIGNRAKRQIDIYDHLMKVKDVSLKDLIKNLETTSSTVNSICDKGVIEVYENEVKRNPIKRKIDRYDKHILNEDQFKVFESVLNSKEHNKFLLHGITGSGKTEIYLQLVGEMLNNGLDSIILLPEISLTPQTINRFKGRFGDNVAVLHSRLSKGERFDQWRDIKEGNVKIVIGARSAIFAPFNNLGLIVIDEEHESTYKSSQNPKYDTIEVANKRVDIENAKAVMGTATPSIESYYNATMNDYKLLKLEKRATKQDLPNIDVVDMREELDQGNRSIFSKLLLAYMKESLDNNRQIILFLNRRGFSSFISCRSCGYVVKCSDCEVSMTYHKNINRVRCHYCGHTESVPRKCPECGSEYIKYFGIGTERIEEEVRLLFPDKSIVRMDSDNVGSKDSYDDVYMAMNQGKIDILIGTQMISKGLDFPNVALVGIIAADTTLNLPDYKAPEKSFQLVTQVAGRTGRGDEIGKVVLQTYSPEHYSIVFSKSHDYESFYDEEIKIREEFLYPPFINLINILIYGENKTKVIKTSGKVYDIIESEMKNIFELDADKYLSGYNPAPIERISKNYRWQILVKSDTNNLHMVKNLIKKLCILNEYKLDYDGVKFSIDINPSTIL